MKTFLLLTVILLVSMTLRAQDTARGDAKITNATVYFGYGAELVQEVKLQGTSSTKFIVINQLSTNVDINSLQINCPEEVTILSHRYTLFYPVDAIRAKDKETLKLEDSIEVVIKDISRIDNSIDIEEQTLSKTGILIEAAMSNNGNKAVTSAEVLKLVSFYNATIEKSKNNIFNFKQTRIKLLATVDLLRKRINVITTLATTNRPKPYGQLILQVISKKEGEIPVYLSYYTNSAGWTPVYDVRVNSKTNKVKLVYKASLTQSTGIDWKNTKLTLSTGTPNFGVAAPLLTPWFLQLYVPELYRSLQGKVAGLNVARNRIQSMEQDKSLDEVVITGYGTEIREQRQDSSVIASTLQDFTTLNEGQLNTNFDIDLPYDIESDGLIHSVTIKDEEITCNLKNYSVPRIDKDAYLLAEVADWQNLDLLPGDANIIMDNTYIGKSIIDPNTTADTLNLALGKDKRLAVKRSLVKELSGLKSSSGNSKQTFTYELMVKNNKLTDVMLLLKDQYPLSTIKDIEVKLEDGGEAIVNEETGVLTWKLNLKPGESRKVRFTYSVKFPKDKRIVNLK